MEPWISIIADVGFPVAVTFYLLHRVEGKLDQLIDTLHQLPEKIISS
ncbi:YvrJ family protein [Halobacillus litoralis]|uniref:YvrJ family protein n=1 Tax=Halobacillus litoralis TaxID=45668 RepID=A0A410M910_9BACI|nr:YvrJ family protein [Halobacillus litoralis]QAS51215.1 YvrJ family protein [Halobacillus litoralis]